MPAKKQRSMLPMTQYEKRRLATLKKIEDALERLIKGFPTHEQLKNSICRVSVSTVAKEAGVGRNSVYGYPHIIEKIERLKDQRTAGQRRPDKDGKIDELRQLLRHEREQNQRLATQNASLLQRTQSAEQELEKLHRNHQKLIRETDRIRLLKSH